GNRLGGGSFIVNLRLSNVGDATLYSALMFAALMIGHHFSLSALCCAASASGVCLSRGQISWPTSVNRWRTAGSAKLSTSAAWTFAMTALGVPFGAQTPCPSDA